MYSTLPPYLQQQMGGVPPWHLMQQQPQERPIIKPNITLKIDRSPTKPNCPGGVCPWTPRKVEVEPPQPLKEENKYIKKSRTTEEESESDTTASSTIHKGKLFLTVCLGLIIIFGSLAASMYLMYYFGIID